MESWKRFVSSAQQRSPRLYYHVTSASNRENIEVHGIYGSTKAGDRDYTYSDGDEDVKEKRIYLFSSQNSAFMAAFSNLDSGVFGGAQPPFIFVKVNLAKAGREMAVHADLELPDFDAYYVTGDLPSRAVVGVETEAEVTERLENEENDEYNVEVDGAELYEEIDKIRVFEIEMMLKISGGIDDTLTDIRSIKGVTIVSTRDTQRHGRSFLTRATIKFHPSKEAMTGQTYVKQILVPTINSRDIPGCIVLRQVPHSLKML